MQYGGDLSMVETPAYSCGSKIGSFSGRGIGQESSFGSSDLRCFQPGACLNSKGMELFLVMMRNKLLQKQPSHIIMDSRYYGDYIAIESYPNIKESKQFLRGCVGSCAPNIHC